MIWRIRLTKEQIITTAAALAAAVLVLGIYIIIRHVRRKRRLSIDDMEGFEFEQFCARMLEDEGFEDVTLTRASRDFGADILAVRDGITYAIQCKCYSEPVGVKAIQEIYAGRDFYDRMVGVVMTNSYFTAPAKEAADKLKIIMWDRDYISDRGYTQ